MAELEFYMQCEEEDLAPCQSIADETILTVDIGSAAHNGHVVVSPVPSDGGPAVSPPALAVQSPGVVDVKTTVLPTAAAPVVAKQLLSNMLQPVQMAARSTTGQPIYIASQAVPGTPQNLTASVGYIIPTATGQSIAFLTPAQANQMIAAQVTSPSGTPRAASQGNYTTVQIPINLTIRGPSSVQNFTAVASTGMPAMGLSSSSVLPFSSPADPVQMTTPPPSVPPVAAAEMVVPEVQPPEVETAPAEGLTHTAPVAVQNHTVLAAVPTRIVPPAVHNHTVAMTVPTRTVPVPARKISLPTRIFPASVLTHTVPVTAPTISVPTTVSTQASSRIPNKTLSVLAPKPQAQNSAPRTIVTQVFQGASRPPQTCSLCGASYKVVHALRGYLCQCNQELVKGIQALAVQPRKRKARRISHNSPVAPSSASASTSSRHLSASPPPATSLKHITTSEIPEGAPSPGTGDYDQHGKLIILVEDFFYGKDPGRPVLIENSQVPIMMKCHLCDKRLKNNIKLMNHMKHHMEMELQMDDGDCHTVCQHCFRNFSSPFTLQCHVETVHSQVECTALCKICELSFDNEPLFLNHMKNSHKPGEMPYMCQVCNFRSSFYSDVINHFRELHKDTNNLQCPYCLKVFKSSNSYQLHYSKHQKKSVLHCDKCRLQFLFSKEKTDHKASFHRTHLKPVQLLGLKPGTKVTIRAYTVTRVDDNSSIKAPSINVQSPPLKEVLSASAPSIPVPQCAVQKVTPTKRKPVESMLEVMTKFQSQCESAKKQFCIECNYEIPDFSSHFPTFVHCSLCRYRTCCSRAYANHMISYHVSRKTTTKYLNLYKPCPKLGKLSCRSCDYTTKVGDLMASHLIAHPGHCSSHCRFKEGFARGYKRFVYIPTELIQHDQRPNPGTFMPLCVQQVGKHSLSNLSKPATHPNQCINLPVSSVHTPSIPIQVQPVDQSTVPDENCGTQPKDSAPRNRGLSSGAHSEDKMGGSLTLAQHKIVLYALCFGVPQAANHFDIQPKEVQSLLLKRQLQLGPPKSREGLIPRASDHLAEWVLCQREQQLPINEGNLFSKAAEIMSKDGGPGISYEWAVDFLLRHNLGVQALAMSSRLLPPKAQEHVHSFTCFMTKQVTTHDFGRSFIGAVDELSIFIDMEQLDPASADSSSMMSAFKLVGDSDPLMDIVLVGLANGTMLPAMVFLKGEPLNPDAPSLPDIIILEAKPDGFSDEERLQLWFDKVWRWHVEPSSGGKGLLVLDTYRGHITDDFLASLNSANTLPGIVPRACSSRLQPLEVCVGPVLRELLQARWSQHVTEAPQDLIGAEPADLALLVAAWLVEMLDVIAAKPDLLQRSFDQVLNSSTEMEPAELCKLVRSLTEAIVVTNIQGQEAEEVESGEKSNTSDITSPSSLPSPPANPHALKKIFEKDSDPESFLGFEDAEMTDS